MRSQAHALAMRGAYGLSNRSLKRPAVSHKAHVKRPIADTHALRDFAKRQHRPFKRIAHRFAPVSYLRFHVSPSAVLCTVVLIIIDPIKREAIAGPWPHVREEAFESAPIRTNRNATAAVVPPAPVFGVVAPVQHPLPHPKLRSVAHAVGSCGFAKGDGRPLPLKTSATLGQATPHRAVADVDCVAAITSPVPFGELAWLAVSDRNKPVESLADFDRWVFPEHAESYQLKGRCKPLRERFVTHTERSQ